MAEEIKLNVLVAAPEEFLTSIKMSLRTVCIMVCKVVAVEDTMGVTSPLRRCEAVTMVSLRKIVPTTTLRLLATIIARKMFVDCPCPVAEKHQRSFG